MTPFKTAAKSYWTAGWVNPIPVEAKFPPVTGYTGHEGRQVSWPDIQTWLETDGTPGNIAIRLPFGIVGIDVDAYGEKTGDISFGKAVETLGTLPPTFTSTSRGYDQPSRIYFYRVPLDSRFTGGQKRFETHFGNNVDILWHSHRYAMVSPSVHPETGDVYAWFDKAEIPMLDVPNAADLPDLPAEWLTFLLQQDETPTVEELDGVLGDADRQFSKDEARAFIAPALDELVHAKNGHINEKLNEAALTLGHFVPVFLSKAAATKSLTEALSKTVYDGKTWKASDTIKSGLSAKTWKASERPPEVEHADYTSADPEISAHDFFTDARLSEAFVEDRLRNKFVWSKGFGWSKWTGTHWVDVPDDVLLDIARKWVIVRMQSAVRKMATSPPRPDGKSLLDAWKPQMKIDRMRAIVTLARGQLLVDGADFDTDPDILNTRNGIVDLRTGELLPSRPSAMCRKVTGTRYIKGHMHPLWTKALQAVDPENLAWFQLFMGQATTGHANEADEMLILQGGGENGKTAVVSEGIRAALGSYYTEIGNGVLMSNSPGHPTEMMALFGARLAVLEETQEARTMNTQRLKQIVGVPTLTARYLFKDEVRFPTSHTMVINTNYLPLIKETDWGTWRRLLAMTFPYKFIPEGKPLTESNHRRGDRKLKSQIRHTAAVQEAVLAWLVEGAILSYADDPIEKPRLVVEATAAWRKANDLVLGFIDSGIVTVSSGYHVLATDLLHTFNDWLESQGNKSWSDRVLTQRFDSDEPRKMGVHKTRARVGDSTIGVLSRPQYGKAAVPGRYAAYTNLKFGAS